MEPQRLKSATAKFGTQNLSQESKTLKKEVIPTSEINHQTKTAKKPQDQICFKKIKDQNPKIHPKDQTIVQGKNQTKCKIRIYTIDWTPKPRSGSQNKTPEKVAPEIQNQLSIERNRPRKPKITNPWKKLKGTQFGYTA